MKGDRKMNDKNPNHPKIGDRITVDPIRNIRDIAAIKKILSGKNRDLLLFTMGINNGTRCGDLLRLKICHVKDLKAGDTLKIWEQKQEKIIF